MANTGKAKDYEFGSIINSFGGYVSSVDKTNIKENYLVRGSQNVYKKLSGTVAVRQGEKRLGVANTASSPISSERVWYTSWGQTYTLLVSNSNLYVVINNVWYSLASGLTKTRYVFDIWWNNTEKKDRILFVNGTSNIFHWSGGFTTIASVGTNTLTKSGTTTWGQSGFATQTAGEKKIMINGVEYTYTGGETTTTLTGVTPDPAAAAPAITAGMTAIQSIVTTANKPDSSFLNDFIKVVNNQLCVGSYTSRLTYIAQDLDFTNFTVPSPQLAGSPGLFTMDGNLKGFGVRQGNLHVGFGASGWAVISFSLVSNNNVLVRDNKVDIKPTALLQAPLAHEFIDSVGDNLIYLGQDNQVHSFGDFNNLFVSGYPSLSQEIARELTKETFTDGSLKCIGEFIYVIAPNSGKTYLYQVRSSVNDAGQVIAERLWHSPFIWNITRIDQIDGVVVGFSNANPQIYQLWDTNQWYDDSPSDEPLPYVCVAAFGYRGEARRQGLWSFDKQFTEGYIAEGTALNLTMNYNYQGYTNALNLIVNSTQQPVYLFKQNLASLGDTSLGDEPLGNGGITDIANDQDSLPKFKCINSVTIINCFEWQPVYWSDSANANWELLALGTNNRTESEQDATFIINKKRN